jgi:hypothetical protein
MANDLKGAALNIADPADFLREKLKYHITRYQHKKSYSQKMTSASKLFAVILGSSVTLLLGLKTSDAFKAFDAGMGSAALILSAVLTVVTGWEAFADYSWEWIRYRTTLASLYDLRDDFEYQISTSRGISEEKTQELYDRIKLTIKETSEEWMSKRPLSISGVIAKGDKK